MTLSAGVWKPPNRNTVDSTRDPALDVVRASYWRMMSHDVCAEAASNILDGRIPFGRVGQIIGHGMPGLICVGCGTRPDIARNGQLISIASESEWMPRLRGLRGSIQALRLTGCAVGAEEDGLELLRRVSCVIDAPVLAPTGIASVGSGSIVLQAGTTWQIGQCGYNGTPHGVGGSPDPEWRDDDRGRTAPGNGFETAPFNADAIVAMEFQRPDFLGGENTSWDGDEARWN